MKFVSFDNYINTQNVSYFNARFVQFNGRNNWFYDKHIDFFYLKKKKRQCGKNSQLHKMKTLNLYIEI